MKHIEKKHLPIKTAAKTVFGDVFIFIFIFEMEVILYLNVLQGIFFWCFSNPPNLLGPSLVGRGPANTHQAAAAGGCHGGVCPPNVLL